MNKQGINRELHVTFGMMRWNDVDKEDDDNSSNDDDEDGEVDDDVACCSSKNGRIFSQTFLKLINNSLS